MKTIAYHPGLKETMTLETIDPNAGYPDKRQAKFIQKWAPKCWELFFGKKYIVPNYRANHYHRQDFINYIEWATLVGLPFSKYRDEIMNACFCNTAGGLYHGRPTLFMETELGYPLLRTELPLDLMADDIKWRWPAMRIYLPKGMIPITKNGREYSMMFMDIGLLIENEGRQIPPALAKELDLVSIKMHPEERAFITFDKFHFYYPDRAIILSGILNCIDGLDHNDLTTYASVKPFKNYTVAQIRAMTDKLKSAWDCDAADDQVTLKMEHLAIQTLLFLSAYPLEYTPETVLRKPGVKGERAISGLYTARFVGRSQLRPDRSGTHHIAKIPLEQGVGYHLMHHFRCGHWKRQPCGPKWQDRKLIWISPYEAGRLDEEEVKK
jgi:hypothetical protein